MTTFVDFQPSVSGPFVFQATLDGDVYTCIVTWNVFGRRYYVNCYSLNNELIFSLPMIGSPAGLALTSLDWDENVATAIALTPHGLVAGQTAVVTIANAVPTVYNGTYQAFAIDDVTFTFALPDNPGGTVNAGAVFKNISLSAGYFDSTLVFRQPNQQFEISP